MFSKARTAESGCKHKLTVVLLFLNIIIAFSLAVITAHMANKGCSRAFAAVAIMSFVYIILNILLIVWERTWTSRCFGYIFIFLVFTIFVVTLVGLGYGATQSVCSIIACATNLQSENVSIIIILIFIDDFHSWFRSEDRKKDYEDKNCKVLSDEYVQNGVCGMMSVQANEPVDDDQKFYIMRGWPIGFCVLQFILTFFCGGCSPKKKDEPLEVSYF